MPLTPAQIQTLVNAIPASIPPGTVGHRGHSEIYRQIDQGLLDLYTAFVANGGILVNVKDYGALGDGATDDTAAIESAAVALDSLGGGILYFPPGVYIVSFYANPGFAGYFHAIHVRQNTLMMGAGEGASIIKLAGGQSITTLAYHIISNRDQDGPNVNIGFANLTVDGNSVAQTDIYYGISIVYTRTVRFQNVTVRNVQGTGNSPPNETFHINASFCTDVTHFDCTVYSDDGGDSASGFSANVSTNIVYHGCIAHDMGFGMGFTHWHCANVSHSGCFAQLCGTHGFNSEFSRDVKHLGCHGGGSSNDELDSFPYPIDTPLGNTASGFVCNATTRYELGGCSAVNNGDNGLAVVNNGSDFPQATVNGGHFAGNTNHGIYFGPSDGVAVRCVVSRSTVMVDNAFDMNIGTTIGQTNVEPFLAGITPPADAVQYVNPYPFDIDVYPHDAFGGHNAINFYDLGGAIIDADPTVFRILRGSYVTPHYVASPSGAWQPYRA